MRSFDRGPLDLRPLTITPGVSRHAEGSAEVRMGHTWVRVTCSVEERVPPHLLGKASGWVTAEYGMLPRSTHTRSAREAAKGKQSGRTQEIQRLIGRALRASVDLSQLGARTFTLDCDVIEADGGTRCASITAAYVALAQAARNLHARKVISTVPRMVPVAAISVGIVKGTVVTDLDYEEDSAAEVDMNLVATGEGKLVEVQGTAEKGAFARAELDALVDAGLAGVARLIEAQTRALAG
ncbi:MAG: ribonuclease PH [Myxococcaceae bacterium]|nr:MAG: ribonuclease PH [Myxococcaceae bacterium]